ncbi:hypothetical protein RRG08_017946 [Elysia crispata]|uniref:Uncharacterized protein n=1 Tax=Elysia crispata TaxID=231223 RepID=A0AAE1DDZ9_9GAST|nr:hypothetical protein RRG08_017946 [Elysia crispata]
MAFKLLILAFFVNASFAYFFQIPVAQSQGREVEQSCLAHAQNGNCEFYNCFERRLPCGRNYYMVKHGHYYCNKIVAATPRFTSAGQEFLGNITQCLMEPLQEIYTRDSVNCHDLEHEAVAAIAPCFNQHNFCEVLRSDAEEFFRIYEFHDLFTRGATKLWRAMMTIAANCGNQYARQFTSLASETLLSSVNNFFSSLGSLRTHSFFGSDDTEASP